MVDMYNRFARYWSVYAHIISHPLLGLNQYEPDLRSFPLWLVQHGRIICQAVATILLLATWVCTRPESLKEATSFVRTMYLHSQDRKRHPEQNDCLFLEVNLLINKMCQYAMALMTLWTKRNHLIRKSVDIPSRQRK